MRTEATVTSPSVALCEDAASSLCEGRANSLLVAWSHTICHTATLGLRVCEGAILTYSSRDYYVIIMGNVGGNAVRFDG